MPCGREEELRSMQEDGILESFLDKLRSGVLADFIRQEGILVGQGLLEQTMRQAGAQRLSAAAAAAATS
jgi:hypothetical protein